MPSSCRALSGSPHLRRLLPLLLAVLLATGSGAAAAQEGARPRPVEPAVEVEVLRSPEPPREAVGLSQSQERSVTIAGESLRYRVETGFLEIRDEEGEPLGEIFHTSYLLPDAEPGERPVTFALNGGPGAASAYLHLGMMGPLRIDFPADGSSPSPPAELVENAESWLPFTDLVFLDPVGTGFSRALPGTAAEEGPAGGQFWSVETDIESLSSAIRLWLGKQRRWSSPKVVAGESFGGFRAALLAQELQEQEGIALNGAILISPVIEYSLTGEGSGSDVLLAPWAMLLPSYAAAALHHGRADFGDAETPAAERLREVEAFARGDFLAGLAGGAGLDPEQRQAFYGRLAGYIGLPESEVARLRGRIAAEDYVKLLLRDQGRLLGFYDATVTGWDPDPGSPVFLGRGDPTMNPVENAFTAGINRYWSEELDLDSERRYRLLSFEVFEQWRWAEGPRSMGFPAALDSLALALANEPELRVWVQHGLHDLVTPYLASLYLIDQTALPDALRARIEVSLYHGGHMFYTHERSRQQAAEEARRFYDRL